MPSAALSCLLLALALAVAAQAAETRYVSTSGSDASDGTRVAPWATLEHARDAVRALRDAEEPPAGGIVIEVAAGAYRLAAPLTLGPEDSGTPEAPIVYRAAHGAEVRLTGAVEVTGWTPVEAPEVRARLAPEAADAVLQADLRAAGLADCGPVGGGGMEVFFDDAPLGLSRWPNEGFVRIVDVLGEKPVDIRGTVGDAVGKFVYEGDRPERWIAEPDGWLHGYWFWDWSDQRQPIASIDVERHLITLEEPYHPYGYRKGQWYYALNMLCELDRPGEWWADRERGILFLWPPGRIEDARVTVSAAPRLLELRDVSHVSFEGFILEGSREHAVTVTGGRECRVADCTIRNVGGWAVRVDGGESHGVVGCRIHDTGAGGVALSGGDRRTLTPAGHFAENNHIHDYGRWLRMYQPGVSIDGVGQRVAHNRIEHAPHMAIQFGGNDHVIELNEVAEVCYESNDAGAIYAGRDWTMRGTVIRHNYFHDITGFEGRGCVGVYLDDMFCGTEVTGNVFRNVTRAAMIGGGRDCLIANNIFVDCVPALHVDARALGWAADTVPTTMMDRLNAMPYREPPWSERYPELLTILDDEPAAPKGNVIARNIIVGENWDSIYGEARDYVTMENNLIGVDPLFVDLEAGDLRLREDSPAWALGFEPIPFEEIGLQR